MAYEIEGLWVEISRSVRAAALSQFAYFGVKCRATVARGKSL